MIVRLEHANLTVRDIDATIRFIRTAFPEFQIRRDQTENDGSRWVHIGTDEIYFALNAATRTPAEDWVPYGGLPGVNHLAVEVDDVARLRQRLLEAGYQESTVPNSHPHRRRIYFLDPDGYDWEFVEYLTEDPQLRHDYELPDK